MRQVRKLLIAAHNGDEIATHLSSLWTAQVPAPPQLVIAANQQQCQQPLTDADLVLAQPALVAPMLAKAKNLQWLQSTFAGVEPLVAPGSRSDYQLTGVKGLFGPLISEYVFAYVLQRQRHLREYQQSQALAQWQPRSYQSLRGITMAVVGLGSIGTHVAQTAKHFGMRVIGVSRRGLPVAGVDLVIALEQLQGQLAQADVVVLTLPATPSTHHFVDASLLKTLRPSAMLINVGRGALVDEQAVASALVSAELGAAVLDVFAQEPLPAASNLWQTPNLYVTPHVAAVTFAKDIAELFFANYSRWLTAQPLHNCIDFQQGY